MKHNTDTINEIIFTHFPASNPGSYSRINCCRHQASLFISTVKHKIATYRGQLQSGIATLGIGTILFIAVFLFLSQLAEYGWK